MFEATGVRDQAYRLQDARLLASASSRVIETAEGQLLILIEDDNGYAHPWITKAHYAGGWKARVVVPGMVNGLDPRVPGVEVKDSDGTKREAVLTDSPEIPLNTFRTPGGEGDKILDVFLALGVREPKTDNISFDALGGVTIVDESQATNATPPRELRAVDFYIAKSRATFAAQVTLIDASGTSGVIVDYGVKYDTSTLDREGTRTRFMQTAKFQPVRKPTLAERLFGDFQDEGEDRLHICTVFLLSPPNSTGEPDASWTAYVQNHVFWHLKHHAPNEVPAKQPDPIRFHSGLAGGLGDLVINQYLALNNDLSAQISAAVNNTTPEGQFCLQ